ncbi:hypothetical protein Clacol_003715 [Clathrus columnatus]|uniref:Uncharacterized protein n=1 Tax=Clathrus columnatus TaxID=1419009 RepID=A0AAV5A7K8_9AGAM|nr:hypothetical protein Clacol_003715 [Clathrus columnatus]
MATVPRPWSQDEDDLLRQAVAAYGEEPGVWKVIASSIPGRSNKACRKRWLHSLSPKAPWTPAEDDLLLKLYASHTPPRWSLIAKQIPGRTDDACSKRYREALDPLLKKDSWSDEEDSRLLELTSQLGTKWTQVGHAMGRSGLGCRNRWRLLQRKQRSRKNAHESCALSRSEQHDRGGDHRVSQGFFNVETLLSDFAQDQHVDCLRPESNIEFLSSPSYNNHIDRSIPCAMSTISSLSQALGFISNNSPISSLDWQCAVNSSTDSSSPCLFSLTHSSISMSPSSSDESHLHVSPSESSHVSDTSQTPEIEYSSPEKISRSTVTKHTPPNDYTGSSEPPATSTTIPIFNKCVSKRTCQVKRLSAHLPANAERTILPYACGHSSCWPGPYGHGISNFATASDLAEHKRLDHGQDTTSTPDNKDKPFRCALEGQTHTPTAHGDEGSSQANHRPASVDISDPKENHKVYQCPRSGCSNSYKQRTGLAYHLAHGHPIDLAQLDVIPPALSRKILPRIDGDTGTNLSAPWKSSEKILILK